MGSGLNICDGSTACAATSSKAATSLLYLLPCLIQLKVECVDPNAQTRYTRATFLITLVWQCYFLPL